MADRPAATPASRSASEQYRPYLLGALIVLAAVFALLNLDKVKVDLIFSSPRIPLIIVILGCLVVGALIDRLLIVRGRHRRG